MDSLYFDKFFARKSAGYIHDALDSRENTHGLLPDITTIRSDHIFGEDTVGHEFCTIVVDYHEDTRVLSHNIATHLTSGKEHGEHVERVIVDRDAGGCAGW